MSTPPTRVDLRPDHWAIVRNALRRYVPDREVLVFGSRATCTAKEYSDLDLAIMGEEPLSLRVVSALEEALGESDLPFKVNIVDWARIDEGFRRIIRGHGVVVWGVGGADRATGSVRGSPPRPRSSGIAGGWPTLSLRSAGVTLFDCEHRTPPAQESGYPYVGIPQVKDGRIDLAGVRRISSEHFDDWTRKSKPQPLDVVLSRRCNPGTTAFVPKGLEFALGQNLVLLRSNGTRVCQPFLRWLVRGPQWWEQVGKYLNVGAVFDSLKCADIPQFQLSIPPLSEQRAIAHILGTLDDKIELNTRMNETLEAMARALFKSWFVDFDPVRAKMEGRDTGLPQDFADLFPDRLVDSEMGEMPEGWEVFRLNQLAKHHTESTSPARSPGIEYEHFSIPAYDAGQRPVVEPGSGIKSNKTLVLKDAVLLSKLNPRIPRVWVPADSMGRPQICSTEFLVFTPRSPANKSLLFALFTDQNFRALLKSMVTGTSKSHQRVPPKALKTQEVLAGSPRVFKVFGEVMGSSLAGVLRNRSEASTLAALRDALLPNLISGEIRLDDADRAMELIA